MKPHQVNKAFVTKDKLKHLKFGGSREVGREDREGGMAEQPLTSSWPPNDPDELLFTFYKNRIINNLSISINIYN